MRSRFRVEIELHAPLVGIERKKESAPLGVGDSGRKGPPVAHPAIFARFDLDHIRPVISQEPGREGARHALTEFQNAHLP